MKKIISIGSALLLLVVLVAGLVACSGGNKGLTDPQLIKVKTAFDGVESSMNKDSAKNASVKSAAYSGLKMAAGMTEDAALTAIWNLYEEGDKQSNTSPELNYDEPPMRQFQYLKAIFDETGATERINLVEECSRRKAEEMGMTMEEYTKYTFEHCSRGHFNNEEGAL